MPSFKTDIICTAPVAIQKGSEFHVPNPRPWHMSGTEVSCPQCDATYFMDEGFSHEYLLNQLQREHTQNRPHPLYIASEPAFTRTQPCSCEKDAAVGCSFRLGTGETCSRKPTKTYTLYLDPKRFNADGTVNPEAKEHSTPIELCVEHENGWDIGPGLVVRRFGNNLGTVRH